MLREVRTSMVHRPTAPYIFGVSSRPPIDARVSIGGPLQIQAVCTHKNRACGACHARCTTLVGTDHLGLRKNRTASHQDAVRCNL